MRYLDPVALARLGTFQLKARTIVEGALTGLHRSPHHGSSVEFAEHKEYAPGDEIRHIDWKAYARFDRYYVKRFEDETELSAYIVLDRSGSMTYRGAGLAKLEYAAYLAGAVAYLLNRQQDRAGLYAFGGGRGDVYIPPRARASHLHDLLASLETVVDEGGGGPTEVARALDSIAEKARHRRSLVVLVSDLFDRSPDVGRLLKRLKALRHDVAVFQILDPDEMELPFEGVTLFESLEDDRRILADPETVRSVYLKELGAFLEGVRQICTDGDIEYHRVVTSQPLEKTLRDFLVGRQGRNRGPRRRMA